MALAFRTYHGTLLTAEKNTKRVAGDRTEARSWETFTLERISDTHVAIKTSFGTYLTAEEGGGREASCNRTAIGEWETFGYWIRPDGTVAIQASNGQWLRVGASDEGHAVTFTKDGDPEAYEIFIVEEVPDVVEPGEPGQPGAHPDPVVGQIRVHGNGDSFKDDTGLRVFVIAHMGDLVARWMYIRNDEDRAKILGDLDAAAAAGYHILRAWWHLDLDFWPWNEGGDPPYPGVHTERTPGFVEKGIELAHEVARRGMRIAIGAGGIGRMNSAAEEQMAHTLHRVVVGAGPEKFAWAEAVNEPSSTHATSDNDGDNQPPNLTKLAKIIAGDTGLMWHLGHWDNNNYEESGRFCVEGMVYNYVHPWRGGNVFNKIDRPFTWCRVFKDVALGGNRRGRLTVAAECNGWPVSGQPLRYVSATENGHELNSHEALAQMACSTAVRGMPGHMSGTGVQRFESFERTVGWRQIPWLCRQLPKDVATFDLFHGGQSDGRIVIGATTNGAGVLARADQAIHHDGRFVSIIYNQRADQDQAFPFRRSARFTMLDTEHMTTSEHEVRAGESFRVGMLWGRVLVGHAQ